MGRKNAIPIYDTERPLKAGVLPLLSGLSMPGCIRDAAPDVWGRRVLINKIFELKGADADSVQVDEFTYLTQSSNKDVLLIERFERIHTRQDWQRKCMVSALTLLGLDEMLARDASYQDPAEMIRHKFTHASLTLKELFSRLVFNIRCGNADDHARNHAAFWDGHMLTLTPADDICPQARCGNEASQTMLISDDNRMS